MAQEKAGGEAGPLSPLELSGLVAGRLCHDLAGAIGAVLNGLELIEEEDGGAADPAALAIVRRSAALAADRLEVARLAFGTYGGAQTVETVEVERLLGRHFASGRVAVEAALEAPALELQAAKLLVNLAAVAAGAVPRGGTVAVTQAGQELRVVARGEGARVPADAAFLAGGGGGDQALDGRAVRALLVRLLAAELGRAVVVEAAESEVVFRV